MISLATGMVEEISNTYLRKLCWFHFFLSPENFEWVVKAQFLSIFPDFTKLIKARF